jgi:hypothetical protein
VARSEKPLAVVSVSSPYDFAMDPSIGTYICTYDFTETALQALVKVLRRAFSNRSASWHYQPKPEAALVPTALAG